MIQGEVKLDAGGRGEKHRNIWNQFITTHIVLDTWYWNYSEELWDSLDEGFSCSSVQYIWEQINTNMEKSNSKQLCHIL